MNKKIIYFGFVVVAILSIPYLFNFPWTTSDYIIAAILLSVTGLIYEFVTRKITNQKKKIFAGLSILVVFIYIWTELAVGIFTNLGS